MATIASAGLGIWLLRNLSPTPVALSEPIPDPIKPQRPLPRPILDGRDPLLAPLPSQTPPVSTTRLDFC
ncbi:MAG TPA: hypothetical protein IGP91_09430 [Thermosynechococcus sp. M46_R2017_013]|nr:hypothetical protein [Thermosynechococcus sp. M46_R2017_013]